MYPFCPPRDRKVLATFSRFVPGTGWEYQGGRVYVAIVWAPEKVGVKSHRWSLVAEDGRGYLAILPNFGPVG